MYMLYLGIALIMFKRRYVKLKIGCCIIESLNHIFSPLHLEKKVFLPSTFKNYLFSPLQM